MSAGRVMCRRAPKLHHRMMESEGAGSDDVDCIRDYVCSLCPRLASGDQSSAYPPGIYDLSLDTSYDVTSAP